jgi:hypothetical protein
MPLPIISLAILAAVLLGDMRAASAQSPYSYPWCSIRSRTGAMSCYYTSWEQCRVTMSGIGGLCVTSPYYRAPPAPEPLRRRAVRDR